MLKKNDSLDKCFLKSLKGDNVADGCVMDESVLTF